MRTATIRIRKAGDSLKAVRAGFLSAWNSSKYKGEHFDFESPAALFRVLTPKRWELIECLQKSGPLGVRALARELGRDVKRVHDDAVAMIEVGMVEKTADGKLIAPFDEIRADFVMKAAA
ncbi:MAG: DNA-binding protein [Sulfuritalea sp.]|jgi:predicted transcriptional regulator|nr:DNA-binding protein [Sulfuritalea sp.]